jgi:hypothetical protein
MTETDKHRISFEEIKVKGNELVDKVRDIIEEGNARRIIIKKDDKTVMELPLSIGVGGVTAAILFAPVLAAVGAFAALVSDVRVVIEREQRAPFEEIEEAASEEEASG